MFAGTAALPGDRTGRRSRLLLTPETTEGRHEQHHAAVGNQAHRSPAARSQHPALRSTMNRVVLLGGAVADKPL
jgi:hypothetical protein